MLLASLVVARQVPKFWRHETTFGDKTPAWWLWGDVLWRAFVRCMVFGWAYCLSIFLWGTPYVYLGDLDRDVAPLWWGIPMGAILASGAFLLITVTFFNWPKQVVPPHLRDQPGAAAEWRDAWVQKRRKKSSSS